MSNNNNNIPWASLFILIAGGFMAILDSSIVNVALPKLMSIFGVGAESIQWVMTAYLLVSGVVIPVTGYLGDRFGYKRLYIYTMVAFTIGSALCALAWSNNSLVAFRVIQAMGGGMMIPVSMAIIFRIVPPDKLGMALGVWGITAMLAPAVGPTAGGYLVDNFSWHTIFTINIPIGIVVVILAGLILKETHLQTELKFDVPGFVLSGLGCFALLLALSEGQDKGWTSQYIVTLFVSSFFLLLLFVLWELQTPQPMLDIRLLRNPVFAASLATTAILTIGLFAAIFLIPIYAQNLMGLTPMQTGLLLMPMALMSGLMMPISGKLYDKIGAFPLCAVGMVILIITTYKLHVISLNTDYHWLQRMLVIRAAGMGLMMMPITTAGMNTMPPFLSGRASAFNNLVRQISASLGIAFLTWVMLRRQVYHAQIMADHASLTNPVAPETIHRVGMQLASAGIPAGQDGATALLALTVQQHSMALGIGDTFIVSTVIILFAVPLIFMLSKKRVEAQREIEMKRYAP
ncbi:DHA2 family efflux MFS transporter permease subunit [Desulfoscipio geothermicus]|uniref:Drug resistance transporter, EmrB/QacA subfamily n=1 Tax=Desulfoscipio geothermicus DSM 3669 TaxID=1121426 RepID=A0A1I6E8Q6_9FIRM|nr:DHA2 family efflux MFS transporter permease subunit [Desulfoscipio geothermicus]SFR14123.1 drug resistance transporter, EmrB/QacA subfamily [Desulfoscipio geothermicus DSM 3669]